MPFLAPIAIAAASTLASKGISNLMTPKGPKLATAATGAQAQQATGSAQNALQQQNQFVNALNQGQGLQNQQGVFEQLQGVSQGVGPNPALDQLNQATGQNVANQAALMGSQRGVSANPALLARLAAQQGAGIQQDAAGQAAALQSQQQLNAMSQLGGIAEQQVQQQLQGNEQQNAAAQGLQQNLLNAVAQQNQARQAKSNARTTDVNTTTGALAKGISGAAAGMAAAGNNPVQAPAPANDIASITRTPKTGGGTLETVTALAQGGEVQSSLPHKSSVGRLLYGNQQQPMMAQGGKVPALVSPGEKYLSPNEAEKVAQGKKDVKKAGQTIPGKAKVPGDSLKNDTVKKDLKEGGVVIPRSITQGKDSEKKMHEFVTSVLSKKSGPKRPKK